MVEWRAFVEVTANRLVLSVATETDTAVERTTAAETPADVVVEAVWSAVMRGVCAAAVEVSGTAATLKLEKAEENAVDWATTEEKPVEVVVEPVCIATIWLP